MVNALGFSIYMCKTRGVRDMSFFVEAPGDEPQVLTQVLKNVVQEKCGNCNKLEGDCTDPISGEDLNDPDAVWKLPDLSVGNLGTCVTKKTIENLLKYSTEEENTFVSPFDRSKLIKLTAEQIESETFQFEETAEDRKRKWEDVDVENLTSAQLPRYLNCVVKQFPPSNRRLNVFVNVTIDRAVSRFLTLFLANVTNVDSMWPGLDSSTKNTLMYLLLEYSQMSFFFDVGEVAQVFRTELVSNYIKGEMLSEHIEDFIFVPLCSYATDDIKYIDILNIILTTFESVGFSKVIEFSKGVWEANVLPPWPLFEIMHKGQNITKEDYLTEVKCLRIERSLAFRGLPPPPWRDQND